MGLKPEVMTSYFCRLLLLPAFALGACALTSKGDTVNIGFTKDDHYYRLVAAVPDGSNGEKHNRDDAGNLVRIFKYADGAEFFIACRDGKTAPVIALATLEDGMDAITQLTGAPGRGMSADGFYYNRQVKDGFMIGYNHVPAAKRAAFEQALQSVSIRR